jgi:DNA-binding GntR family transcriptional regulator
MSAKTGGLPARLFSIDRTGPVPLYYQLATRLEEAIESGELPSGARIENEITMSERLGISRPTVRRAIQSLVEKGLLYRRRGIGTQVVQGSLRRRVELTSLYEDLQREMKKPSTQLLTYEAVEADEHAAAMLDISVGDQVLHLRRLRFAGDEPIAVLDNILPMEFATFSEDDITAGGLYELLQARGITMRMARQRISARQATAAEAKLLHMPRGKAVLTMDRTAFDPTGRPVELGHHCYQPDLYSFEVTLLN